VRFSPIRHLVAAVVAMLILAPCCQPARAQLQLESREAIALQNQILELQRELQGLRDQAGSGTPTYLGRGGSPPPAAGNDLLAQLVARVGSLEDQVRQLRGRIDETANQVQQQGADLGKRIDDLAFRMQNPGATPPAAGPTGAPPGPPQGPYTSSPPPGTLGTMPAAPIPLQPGAPPATMRRTPEVAMQEGNAALARRDYAAAEAAAREVLANRTSPRAYDAQFLLAQALSGERQFSQAAIAYDDAYNRSRKGMHAQDALLGLAISLTAINEKKAACDTLGKLRTEFPSLRPDVRDTAAGVAQRSGCR
jgi:TolA-binding protein